MICLIVQRCRKNKIIFVSVCDRHRLLDNVNGASSCGQTETEVERGVLAPCCACVSGSQRDLRRFLLCAAVMGSSARALGQWRI